MENPWEIVKANLQLSVEPISVRAALPCPARFVSSQIQSGLLVLDEKPPMIRANDAIAETVGVSRDEIVGQAPRSLVVSITSIFDSVLRGVLDDGQAIVNVCQAERVRKPGKTCGPGKPKSFR